MDELVFASESTEPTRKQTGATWKVLIVDDEKDVHEATLLALGREQLCGRPLEFAHAYSAEEARSILAKERDFAVILLDVVMEVENAGFELVHYIREVLCITDTRIILRTGQPGYAPELDTIARYEINDYKAKSDLTRNKLYTVITASIRAYTQIRALELSKRGLERIIRASKELLYLRGYREFASGVITQITGFFNLPEEGLVCVKGTKQNQSDVEPHKCLEVVAAAGQYEGYLRRPVSEIREQKILSVIINVAKAKRHIFDREYSCLYFATPDDSDMIVYLAASIDVRSEDLQLLELFSTNIAACIDNVALLEQRHQYAYRDQLIGIPNRLSFQQNIEDKLQRHEKDMQVILIDIDHFAALNDTISTENGDIILQQIAERLMSQHPDQLVARVSGDMFGLLGHRDAFSHETIQSCFIKPFEVNGAKHSLSATQGRVDLGDQKASNEVMAQANIALKRAKRILRGSFQSFENDMLKETESRVNLLQNLRHAFDHESLYMVFQPKINLMSDDLIGFEALMRWKTLEGNFITPDKFIPLAEASGLIVLMGEWALKSSLVQIRQFREKSGLPLTVAVNVSVVQFAHPDFISMVRSALEFAECHPSWLELEITESFAMHDLETVQSLMRELYKLGVRISIDDFGTGFSSLSYLEKLNVHSLKIDKSFIDRIQVGSNDTRIPETILTLGHALDLEVVAEGVETPAQLKWLKEYGCEVAQGFLFAKPLDPEVVLQWIEEYQRNRSS